MSGTKFLFINCKDCGQRIIQRGRLRMNSHGLPLNHDLSCQAKTPDDANADGLSTSTQGDDAA